MGTDTTTRSFPDDGQRRVSLCGHVLPHPGHVCAFFDSRDQKYDTLVPFFADGIEAGDRIINVVDAAERPRHLRTLEERSLPVSEVMANDQLTVLTSEEAYLADGEHSLDAMLEMLDQTLHASRRENYCVRTCGEMNWVSRAEIPIRKVLEYESRVNFLVPSFQCTLLCVYDLSSITSALMSDILATHPFAIVKGKFRPNPFYVEPEEYLEMLRNRAEV
jgi:hypothetical protein